MKLLIERQLSNPVSIKKQDDLGYYIEGIFLQSEIKNQNGRIYPVKTLEREVGKYISEKIEKNRATGELGHPENPSINLDRISHKILSLRKEGNNFIGKAKILDTPYGKIVKSLIDEGVDFGVSSRGLGSLKEQNGAKYVCEDYHLVTPADIVSEPSAPEAWMVGLMENKEWAWENGKLIEIEQEIRNEIKRVRNRDEDLLNIFDKLLNSIT